MTAQTSSPFSLGSRQVAPPRAVAAEIGYQRAYARVFLFSLILCWSPSNMVGYFAPSLCIVWFLIESRSLRTLRRLVVALCVWAMFTLPHILITPNFAVASAALSLLTYSAILFAVIVPAQPLANSFLRHKMEVYARWVVLIQGVLGILQACYGFFLTGSFDIANGDFVEGTIHPALAAERSFSNPMFAVNMVMLLLFLLPSVLVQRKGRAVYLIGLISLILASVLHVLLFLVVAGIIAFLLYAPDLVLRKRGILLFVSAILAGLLGFMLLRENFSTVRIFAGETFAGRTPRAIVVQRTFSDMQQEYPWMPMIGFGPGQFSSRAGLIGTGLYFGGPYNPVKLPLLPTGMSKPFEEYVFDLWLEVDYYNFGNNTSSTYKPFFSWLSFYTEGGVWLVLVVVATTVWLLAVSRKNRKRYGLYGRLERLSFGTGLLLLLFLGAQENYWEVAQAIFPGIVMLKVQFALIRYPPLLPSMRSGRNPEV